MYHTSSLKFFWFFYFYYVFLHLIWCEAYTYGIRVNAISNSKNRRVYKILKYEIYNLELEFQN